MTTISADAVQLAHVAETTPGVTPASPVFDLWRITGESLTFSPNAVESTEIGSSGRFRRASNVAGTTVAGDINFELAPTTALDAAIAGVLANPWGEGPLTPSTPGGAIEDTDRNTVGKTLQGFTIEKRWPQPATVAGPMDMTATPAGVGTNQVTVTLASGPAVGSGMFVLDYQTDKDKTAVRAFVTVAPGEDENTVALAMEAVLDEEVFVQASVAGAVLTLTAASGASTIDSCVARMGKDEYVYQRYRSCTYSSMSLSATPNEIVTGSVTIVAGLPELDYLPLESATYTSAGDAAVMTASEVIDLTVGDLYGVETACWSSLTLNLDSQNREIACIGFSGAKESTLGTFFATLEGEIYFAGDQSGLEALLDNEVIGDSVVSLSNADGDVYRFDLYQSKIVDGSVVAEGQNTDVSIPITIEAAPVTVQDTGSEVWQSGLVVSRKDTAPILPPPSPAPAPITGVAAAIVGNESVLTFAGGPADANYQFILNYEVDAEGSPGTDVLINLHEGDSIARAVSRMVDAVNASGGEISVAGSSQANGTVTVGLGTAGALDAVTLTRDPV